ncbi:MAG: PorP/SprF family type IX secretion system membrane protein [Prevotellaceae bacterium]|jgi:type IX secretion system PorP/SprF family membrane protein|nr:PorP/SprF family type IX secretion system membrane protein [Prevotellaceae bacterium]
MKKLVLILIVLFCGVSSYGQSDAILTQQWFSRINANPAATGNTNDVNVFLLHRTQWSGFENDAPQTSLLNATNYFEKINSGVGLSLSYDREGELQTNYNAKVAYAYHLKFSENVLLSLGLGLNLQHRSIDWTKIRMKHPDDPEIPNEGVQKETGVDFDFGLEFSTSRFTFGAALNRIGKSDVKKLTSFKNGQQIYAYGRYRITLCEGLDIAPTVTYVNANSKNVWESGVLGFITNKFWVGTAYRHEIAWAFLAGFEFNMFRVGYAYDHYIKDSSNLGGTHEIMLSVKIPHK